MAFANLLDGFNLLHFQERPLLHYNYSDWVYHFLGAEITILLKFIQVELLQGHILFHLIIKWTRIT